MAQHWVSKPWRIPMLSRLPWKCVRKKSKHPVFCGREVISTTGKTWSARNVGTKPLSQGPRSYWPRPSPRRPRPPRLPRCLAHLHSRPSSLAARFSTGGSCTPWGGGVPIPTRKLGLADPNVESYGRDESLHLILDMTRILSTNGHAKSLQTGCSLSLSFWATSSPFFA